MCVCVCGCVCVWVRVVSYGNMAIIKHEQTFNPLCRCIHSSSKTIILKTVYNNNIFYY